MLDTKLSEVKAHAKFSASGSERWLNCPGSIALSERAPPQAESGYAAEGTEAHACLELLLKNRQALKKAKALALKKYPLDMVEYALDAVDWILSEADGELVLCETRVDASPFTCADQFGTLDAAIVREFDRLTVIDYKYGAGIAVDPTDSEGDCNSQLAYYALGISHQYHHNFAEVELVVIQPRAFHPTGETIRSAVFTMDRLLAWGEYFREGVKRVDDPLAGFAAGSWCKFCPAAVICPEIRENAMQEAQIVFADGDIQSVPEARLLSIPDLGKALDAAERLETYIKALYDHANHVLRSGGDITGWKLVEKRGIRRWVDIDKASDAAMIKRWGPKVFSKPVLLSPAQFEKALMVKGQDNSAVTIFLDEHVTSKSSGTTLVKASDKRPAVKSIDAIFSRDTQDSLE